MQQRALDVILDQQARLSRTQQQLATGQRILQPADDPVGATRAMGLERAISAAEQHQDNADMAQHRLALEEETLQGVTGLLQRVRELALQGNQDTLGAEDRLAIAAELEQRLEELLALANTTDAGGEYLFAGYSADTQPFGRAPSGAITYAGDQGQRFLRIGPETQVATGDSGARVFQLVRTGNGTFTTAADPANTGTGIIDLGSVAGGFVPSGYVVEITQPTPTDPLSYEVRDGGGTLVAGGTYTSGAVIAFNGAQLSIEGDPAVGDRFAVAPSDHQDILTTVAQLAEAFASAGDDPVARARLHNQVNGALGNLDNGLQNVLEVRSAIGGRLNLVDSQKDYNDAFILKAREALSAIQDLDYAEAVSRLNLELAGLQAAQQSYLRIQGLSLFNYLG